MKKEEQDPIVYRMEALEDLVIKQQQSLEMANNLLDMKSRLVELCEEETELYKKENNRLHRIIFWLSVCLGFTTCGWLITSL